MARVFAVEDGDAGAIDEVVVGSVVKKDDAGRREDGRGAGLGYTGVELSGADGEDGLVQSFGPMDEVGRIGEAHLIGLVGAGAEEIHPVFAVDFFGDDGSGFGPTDIPFALIGG